MENKFKKMWVGPTKQRQKPALKKLVLGFFWQTLRYECFWSP